MYTSPTPLQTDTLLQKLHDYEEELAQTKASLLLHQEQLEVERAKNRQLNCTVDTIIGAVKRLNDVTDLAVTVAGESTLGKRPRGLIQPPSTIQSPHASGMGIHNESFTVQWSTDTPLE